MKVLIFLMCLLFASVHSKSVEQSLYDSCSTTIVAGLSRQLIEEMNCIRPGLMSSFAGTPGISLSAATFPYAQTPAVNALKAAVASRSGTTLQVNSALRTLAQQYVLWKWGQVGRCGISVVAAPGRSNHNGGLAIDIDNYSTWKSTLEARSWQWYGSSDAVHFTYVGSGTTDIRSTSVLAFQKLWNRNNPGNTIAEDGEYGPGTEAKLKLAPASGFPIGAQCAGGNTVSCVATQGAGTCQSSSSCTTNGGTTGTGGQCSGSNICCVPGAPPAPDSCIVSAGVTGTCKDTTQCASPLVSYPGKCAGPSNIQCCAPASGSPPANGAQTTNQAGLDLIKSFEGWFPNFYIDPVGIRTIGYGHACHVYDCNKLMAKSSTGTWYQVYAPLTRQQGDDLLRGDLQGGVYESCVRNAVTRTIDGNQYSALVSFVFNVGCGGFRGSTLLSRVNSGASDSLIRDAFLMWVKAGGQTLPGLVRRRNAEADLYISGGSSGGSDPSTGIGTRCYKNGKQGICLASASCTGTKVAGLCPGSSDVQCCMDVGCTSGGQSGMCIPSSVCLSTPASGLCPGPAEIKCCTSLPAIVDNVMPCPAGATWVASKIFCASAEHAYGPFTAAEIQRCRDNGGGAACDTRSAVILANQTVYLHKWGRAFAESIRISDDCPLGTQPSQNYDGYCLETLDAHENIWAGFPPELVTKCIEMGGGLACNTIRWGSAFFRAVALASNSLTISPTLDENITCVEDYCGDVTNEYSDDQANNNIELATEGFPSVAAYVVPTFILAFCLMVQLLF